MKSSMFVFGTDIVGEGVETVLENVTSRAGVDTISLSATYHNARDVFPHNPRHRVYRHEGDISWFKPSEKLYPAGTAPPLAQDAEGVDVFKLVTDAAGRRGTDVKAWTIYSHNSRLTAAAPDTSVRNVFGDRMRGDLCPSNPLVQDHFAALTADICRYPISTLLAECLHYRSFEHGEHHERYLIDIPGPVRAALGLCFCDSCAAKATLHGVDVPSLETALRQAIDAALAGATGAFERSLAEDLDRYEASRVATITALTKDITAVARENGVGLSFIDHSGAMVHVMTDVTPEAAMSTAARRLGIDPQAAAGAADEYLALIYTDDPEKADTMMRGYGALLGDVPIAYGFRPLKPDCADEGNLAAKVAAAHGAGASRVDFYHYAMMPLERLDWIARALDGTRAAAMERWPVAGVPGAATSPS
jgi:hypothetical protein